MRKTTSLHVHHAYIFVYTAISRKVVGKKVHATIPKGNMGYDQYIVPDTVAVDLLLLLPFSSRTHTSMASSVILSNFFEEKWTQNYPQYMRALFPTTFLETAAYLYRHCTQFTRVFINDANEPQKVVLQDRDEVWKNAWWLFNYTFRCRRCPRILSFLFTKQDRSSYTDKHQHSPYIVAGSY